MNVIIFVYYAHVYTRSNNVVLIITVTIKSRRTNIITSCCTALLKYIYYACVVQILFQVTFQIPQYIALQRRHVMQCTKLHVFIPGKFLVSVILDLISLVLMLGVFCRQLAGEGGKLWPDADHS